MCKVYKDWRSIPIPNIMKSMERDHRGYPCPVILQRDAHGKPLFTVNNAAEVHYCAIKHLCGICGKKMRLNNRWLVASARLFTDFRAAFLDPPMHRECAEYALKVCPYIANPSWGKELAPSMLKTRALPKDTIAVVAQVDSYSQAKPDVFGLGRIDEIAIHNRGGQDLFTVMNWFEVHYWKDGKEVLYDTVGRTEVRTPGDGEHGEDNARPADRDAQGSPESSVGAGR